MKDFDLTVPNLYYKIIVIKGYCERVKELVVYQFHMGHTVMKTDRVLQVHSSNQTHSWLIELWFKMA